MKKLLIVSMMLLAAMTAGAKGKSDWKGRVVDQKGEPVEYANVVVLSKVDSSVVCGTVTAEDGSFNIATSETDGIMMVAMIGYGTQYLAPVDGAVITLIEDAVMLEGAVATAVMPKTKLTGEGLQTSVRGSVLENVGTANDVLAKTPGIIKGQNGLEVIGKGSPLVYINGRKITDSSELERLQSNEIQSVEVITNPGAQYDATVRSVVRIRTVRRQGDGFGFSLNASDSQSLQWAKGNDPAGAVNANYRTGGVDLFGGLNYNGNAFRQISDLRKITYGKDYILEDKGDLVAEQFLPILSGNAGVNWQIADNHFLGGKVEWSRHLKDQTNTLIHDNVTVNGAPFDNITTESEVSMGDKAPHNLGANVYYNGVIGEKLGVDVNLDYFGTDRTVRTLANETSTMRPDARISSEVDNASRMYAAKAVLSYPVWAGQLQIGTEETFSRRSDVYSITGVDIPASSAKIVEDTYAGFASYGFMAGALGMFNAGIRYEYVHYSYEDALSPEASLKRDYPKWFPSLSWAGVAGPVQLMFSYSAKTRRPDYSALSSAIQYNSRYIWQSGNAKLQPETSHNLNLTAVWNFISFVVDYARMDNTIITWSAPYNEEGVVLVQPRNIDTPYRAMSAMVNLAPTIGIWNINYTFGLMPQWLSINAPDNREPSGIRVTKFNGRPIWIAQLFNTFRLGGGWQLELGGTLQTKGYTQNMSLENNYFDLSAAVQKSLLKDGSLVLRLEGSDLANLAHINVSSDFGSHIIHQTNNVDQQKVKLSVRYNFNTTQSKYRGTGAGSDTKSRMND